MFRGFWAVSFRVFIQGLLGFLWCVYVFGVCIKCVKHGNNVLKSCFYKTNQIRQVLNQETLHLYNQPGNLSNVYLIESLWPNKIKLVMPCQHDPDFQ